MQIKIKIPDDPQKACCVQPTISYSSFGLTKEEMEIVNKANAILGPISQIGFSQERGNLVTLKKQNGFIYIDIAEDAEIISY